MTVPWPRSSEAQVAEVSGLARLDTLEHKDRHCFRVEHVICAETMSGER